MSDLSNLAENAIVEHLLSISTWGAVAASYVALWVGDPGETGAGNDEVAGAIGYTRQEVTSGQWDVTEGTADNNTAITFGPASASWGTITHVAIFSAVTSGDFLAYVQLAAPKSPTSGDSVEFAIGELVVDIA
jgi:hypothetical protein